MFQTARRFLRHSGGNVAMMMALAGFPLCIAVGAAVDYSRASSAKSAIQAATDAAALAAAKDPNLSEARAKEVVNQYLAANGIDTAVAHVNEVKIEYDKKTGAVSVSVSGQLDTSLMSLAGIQSMDIGGHSEVQAGSNALEVALVLDNTFSMTAENRMPALKTASHALLNELFGNVADSTPNSSLNVAIVPFAEYVNVGLGNRNATWLDVKNDYDTQEEVWINTGNNCSAVATSNDGVSTGTSQSGCTWIRDPANAYETFHRHWNGCVGSRGAWLDEKIDQMATRYPGLLEGDDPRGWWYPVKCAPEMTALTANKSKLAAAIDAMTPLADSGSTYIPVGLLWGWNLLDANAPYTEAKTNTEMADLGGTKAIVLMTDGDNTVKPEVYPWHYGNENAPGWGAVADQKTSALCTNIKAAGIKIYTVSLKVTKPESLSMLENCASEPSMAFNANDNAALTQAFKDIASKLAALHLTR